MPFIKHLVHAFNWPEAPLPPTSPKTRTILQQHGYLTPELDRSIKIMWIVTFGICAGIGLIIGLPLGFLAGYLWH